MGSTLIDLKSLDGLAIGFGVTATFLGSGCRRDTSSSSRFSILNSPVLHLLQIGTSAMLLVKYVSPQRLHWRWCAPPTASPSKISLIGLPWLSATTKNGSPHCGQKPALCCGTLSIMRSL